MIDLGRHGGFILASYGVTIIIIAGLVWQSMRRYTRAKQHLAERAGHDNG